MKNHAQHQMKVAVAPVVTPFSAPDDAASPLPTRVKVLSWGENPNARGKRVFVGGKFLESLSSPNYPFAKIAIDFEHNTVPGTPEYERTKEPRAVAGYGAVECVEGEGIFLNVTRWTAEGLAHARDYEDLSAAPVCDAEGNVVALQSVALCRTGAVPGIEFVQCPLFAEIGISALNPQENNMDYKQLLLAMLGIADDAADEQIAAAIEAAKKAKAEHEAEAKKRAEEAEALAAEKEKAVECLSAKVDDLAKAHESETRERILLGARIEGKVVALSAETLRKMTADELRAHVAALPVTVPLNAVTPTREPPARKTGGLDGEAAKIARALGLSEEDMK